jgi:hypothetical protein
VAVLAYVLALSAPLAAGLDFGEGSAGIPHLLQGVSVLLMGAFALQGRPRAWASLATVLVFFGVVLSSLWSSAASSESLVGGLFPWSDASGYYIDANRLLDGGLLSAFSARRPLFAGALATLLDLSGRNLQIALAALVFLIGVAVYLSAASVGRSDGALAGALMALVLLAFARRFVGTTLTDGLGLAFGALAFAVLWIGAKRRHRWLTLLGIFLATIALAVRAGAFFVLPGLILWRAWLLGGSARTRLAYAAEGIGAVGLGFLLNAIVLKGIGPPDAAPFSNFAHTLYGLAAGGKGWNQVYQDNPGLSSLAEPEQSRKAFELALALIRNQPIGLVRGTLNSWSDYFSGSFIGVYGFVEGPVLLSLPVVRLGVFAAAGTGIVGCVIDRREPRCSLLLVALLGILLSVPFVPPIDADLMRAYAATIPVTAAIAGVGAGYGWRWISRRRRVATRDPDVSDQVAPGVGLLLVAFLLAGPLAVRLTARPSVLAAPECPEGQEAFVVRVAAGARIDLVPARPPFQTRVPTVRIDDFRNGLDRLASLYPEIAAEFAGLEWGTTILHTADVVSGRLVWMMVRSEDLPSGDGPIGVCAVRSENDLPRQYGFVYAESIVAPRPQSEAPGGG